MQPATTGASNSFAGGPDQCYCSHFCLSCCHPSSAVSLEAGKSLCQCSGRHSCNLLPLEPPRVLPEVTGHTSCRHACNLLPLGPSTVSLRAPAKVLAATSAPRAAIPAAIFAAITAVISLGMPTPNLGQWAGTARGIGPFPAACSCQGCLSELTRARPFKIVVVSCSPNKQRSVLAYWLSNRRCNSGAYLP